MLEKNDTFNWEHSKKKKKIYLELAAIDKVTPDFTLTVSFD